MWVERLWLQDFRNFSDEELVPASDGLTVLLGDNGQGKSNVLEAIGYLARLESFRGVASDVMVRLGCERGVVRGEVGWDHRRLWVEAELSRGGHGRVWVNRQLVRRGRDLFGALRVTVFSPDDLALVKGGPGERRRYLDEVLVALHPGAQRLRIDVDRIVRQRTTLLRQVGGRLDTSAGATLDVWDARLAQVGTQLADLRSQVVSMIAPQVVSAYERLSGSPALVDLSYRRSWVGQLGEALVGSRAADVRRQVTTIGPHRDDLLIGLSGLPARSHASQGDQRSLALALRLASHTVIGEEIGTSPVLLLDDVFSELDPRRSAAVVEHLPSGQGFLATTGEIPGMVEPALVVSVEGGRLSPETGRDRAPTSGSRTDPGPAWFPEADRS